MNPIDLGNKGMDGLKKLVRFLSDKWDFVLVIAALVAMVGERFALAAVYLGLAIWHNTRTLVTFLEKVKLQIQDATGVPIGGSLEDFKNNIRSKTPETCPICTAPGRGRDECPVHSQAHGTCASANEHAQEIHNISLINGQKCDQCGQEPKVKVEASPGQYL